LFYLCSFNEADIPRGGNRRGLDGAESMQRAVDIFNARIHKGNMRFASLGLVVIWKEAVWAKFVGLSWQLP
jgi:hypothetical protein